MMRAALALVLLATLAGCATQPSPAERSPSDAAMFAPNAMRIHPIFSGPKDFDGDNKVDGIEALLEFEDQFGDPIKATGTVVFELFDYRKAQPDPRGDHVCNPWVGSLRTLADQQARWNRTSRTYLFQLAVPGIREERSYVLTATFDTGTARFFDRVVFEGHPRMREAATRPTTAPVMVPTTPIQPATRGG